MGGWRWGGERRTSAPEIFRQEVSKRVPKNAATSPGESERRRSVSAAASAGDGRSGDVGDRFEVGGREGVGV